MTRKIQAQQTVLQEVESWEPLHTEEQCDSIKERLQVLHTNDYGSNEPTPKITKPNPGPINH